MRAESEKVELVLTNVYKIGFHLAERNGRALGASRSTLRFLFKDRKETAPAGGTLSRLCVHSNRRPFTSDRSGSFWIISKTVGCWFMTGPTAEASVDSQATANKDKVNQLDGADMAISAIEWALDRKSFAFNGAKVGRSAVLLVTIGCDAGDDKPLTNRVP